MPNTTNSLDREIKRYRWQGNVACAVGIIGLISVNIATQLSALPLVNPNYVLLAVMCSFAIIVCGVIDVLYSRLLRCLSETLQKRDAGAMAESGDTDR
jgi:hypothetical protein